MPSFGAVKASLRVEAAEVVVLVERRSRRPRGFAASPSIGERSVSVRLERRDERLPLLRAAPRSNRRRRPSRACRSRRPTSRRAPAASSARRSAPSPSPPAACRRRTAAGALAPSALCARSQYDAGDRVLRDGDLELALVLRRLDRHARAARPHFRGRVERARGGHLDGRAALRTGGVEVGDGGRSRGRRTNHRDTETQRRQEERESGL